MPELHVVPDGRGKWRVQHDAVAGALSEHPSATDAECAAWWHAASRGTERIVVHDRYNRTRPPIPPPRTRAPRRGDGSAP
jgi:hypothetical protein